jgi:Domain of unknown function DUF11
MRVLMRTVVTLVLFVGVLAGSGDAATGSPASQALAHLQAFDESLANLEVDLTAPVVVSTPAETRQRLNGLRGLIGATLANVKNGLPGTSAAAMVKQVESIDGALAAALKAQGAAQLRILAMVKATEGSLEATVKAAATGSGGSGPPAPVDGGGSGSAQVVVKTGGSSAPLAAGTPLLFPERTSLSSFATAGERVQALQLINIGTASAMLTTVSVEGPDAADFTVSTGCDNATLAPGGSATSACFVSVEVRAARYTRPLNASLVVTGSQTGGVGPIKLGLTQSDLALTSFEASPAAGGRLSYAFAVANSGPDPADRVEVDAKLTAPAGTLRLVSSVPQGCLYNPPSGILSCPVGTLPAHAKTPITTVFQLPKGAGRVSAKAAVQSLDFDPTPRNDVRTLVTAVK